MKMAKHGLMAYEQMKHCILVQKIPLTDMLVIQ